MHGNIRFPCTSAIFNLPSPCNFRYFYHLPLPLSKQIRSPKRVQNRRFGVARIQSLNTSESCPGSSQIDRIPFSNFYPKASAVTAVMLRPYFLCPRSPPPHIKSRPRRIVWHHRTNAGPSWKVSKYGFPQRTRRVQ